MIETAEEPANGGQGAGIRALADTVHEPPREEGAKIRDPQGCQIGKLRLGAQMIGEKTQKRSEIVGIGGDGMGRDAAPMSGHGWPGPARGGEPGRGGEKERGDHPLGQGTDGPAPPLRRRSSSRPRKTSAAPPGPDMAALSEGDAKACPNP